MTTPPTVVGGSAAELARWSSTPARRRRTIALAAGIALAALVAVLMTDQGLRTSVGTAASGAVSALRSTTVTAMVVLTAVAVLYQVAAAAAARAAAGVPLPFAELVGVQFVAAAANRFTPVGLGSVAVTGRYFTRRGRLTPAQSAAAVSALTLLGGIADLAAFTILIGVGSAAGLAGAGNELPTLTRRLLAIIPRPAGWWWWAAGAAVGIGIAIVLLAWRRRQAGSRLATAVRRYALSMAALLAHPGRLAALLSASAGTTLLLAAGFAAATILAPSGLPIGDAGALMIGYMVAAAAGNLVPIPGGVGAVDAALVGVLLASGIPLASAVITVLVFRLITFWAPAVIGACLVHRMRRRGAL
ncbi:MAG: lysylphosphatidylglycerol synthase transmembrane domain-containing protein [Nakamurella sp.]